MLCLIPALRALRAALPQARLTLIGLPASRVFLERFPNYLDELIEFPGFPGIPEVEANPAELPRFFSALQGEFDLALQMHGSGTHSNAFVTLLGARASAGLYLPSLWCPDPQRYLPYPSHSHEIHRWTSLVEFLGVPLQGDRLEFPITAEDRRRSGELWQREPGARYACLHPGAFEEARRWPAERFAAVGDELAAQGLEVVITGTEAESELAAAVTRAMRHQAIDLSGRTGLGTMAALLAGSELLVCNDTGVSHLAAALQTASVIIFSASDPDRWAPLDRHRHRVAGQPAPERLNACRHTSEVRGHRCLRDACSSLLLAEEEWRPASVGEVLTHASELLEHR